MATAAEQIPTPAPVREKPRRHLFVGIGVFMTVIVLSGFWPSYFGPLVRGTIDQPLLIHVHAAVFMGWIGLFVAQVTLAARGRLRWHRKLGTLGISYGVLLIGVGLFTAVIRSAGRVVSGVDAERLLYVASLDMALFAPFFAAAVFYRRRPHLHKRLMLVAATVLLVAAVVRLPIYPAAPLRAHLVFLVWSIPILAAIVYDLLMHQNRLVHPVYLCGLAALAFRNYSVPFSQTEAWSQVTQWVTGWIL